MTGATPFRVKGATYGGFARRFDGARFPDPSQLEADLEAIAAAGFNSIRTYDCPPVDLLDLAAQHDLRVMVGIDHDWRTEPGVGRQARNRILDSGRQAVEEAMDRCAGRPEVLAVSVGNEIPVDLVRLHGVAKVERILSTLVADIHAADREMLATYVSFPTTEFLEIEGADLSCFNVFLEERESFRRYVRHLQVVSGDRPLLLTELGLAADVHGEEAQADALQAQLQVLDETGVAGGMVYAWTDEWAVNDEPVTGWGFGITTEDRQPKPALGAASEWARREVTDLRDVWPRVSVVVCAYNEERTIGECLASLEASTYPDLEVIVCDDGSTDRTAEIAGRYPFKLLELPHGGLSRARNAGLDAATGEIVAYLDADAACHPDWLFHLALSMEDPEVVATGGPNLPHPDAGFIERAVAASPGSPMEVLFSSDRAEHVPGCNMAFQKEALEAIDGFNEAYTSAGDDVDVCWKLLDRDAEIAFSAAAQVRHHRRHTIRGYLKQQRGYGRAERMLSGPHRHRFNRLGQAGWRGFVYGGARLFPSLLRPVVYHGYQGQAPFQKVASRRAEIAAAWGVALLPFTVPLALAGLVLGLVSPWFLTVPAAIMATVMLYAIGVGAGVRVDRHEAHPLRVRALAGLLHVLQPLVRTWGRLRNRPLPADPEAAAEWWGDRAHWLDGLRQELASRGCSVRIGDADAGWDLEASRGPFVAARINTAVVWDWEPRWHVRYRLRAAALLLLLTAGLATAWSLWALVVLGSGLAAVALETIRLGGPVFRGLQATTAKAHA